MPSFSKFAKIYIYSYSRNDKNPSTILSGCLESGYKL